jgi:hypothetical protein
MRCIMNNGYHDYPSNKPPKDDHYLISVKPALILKLGLSPSPPILIARYNPPTQEWKTVLGMSMELGDISNDVIAWHDLPLPLPP